MFDLPFLGHTHTQQREGDREMNCLKPHQRGSDHITSAVRTDGVGEEEAEGMGGGRRVVALVEMDQGGRLLP